MKKLNIIFAGTPDFATPSLHALINSEHDIKAVYTQPDRPAGRGRKLTASPVKQLALQHNLHVLQPTSCKDPADLAQLKSFQADLMIVVAYGLLLPEAVLEAFPLACINVHASLLPRWRGAAPIQRAILAGDEETGIAIMKMEKGLDTGPVYCMERCEISATETGLSLHDKLANLGANTLLNCFDKILDENFQPQVQDDTQATYAKKLEKQEAKIDWHDAAINIERKIRAFNPWPVAFTQLKDQTIRLWQSEVIHTNAAVAPGTIVKADKDGLDIATHENILRILKLQFPGAKAVTIQEALNAKKDLLLPGLQFS